MRIKILGKRYQLEITKNIPDGLHGTCDRPDQKNKKIKIRAGVRQKTLMECVIHEILHAADWHKDEAWVEEVAKDITGALWKLGYRLNKADSKLP